MPAFYFRYSCLWCGILSSATDAVNRAPGTGFFTLRFHKSRK